MVCFHQIYRGEDFPVSKLCKVSNVPNGILVGDRPSIQSMIVTTECTDVFFLGDEAQGLSERLVVPFRSISLNSGFAGVPGEYQQGGLHSEILEQCVIARASSEDFNVAFICSYQAAVDSKVSGDVDEASVSHVDE